MDIAELTNRIVSWRKSEFGELSKQQIHALHNMIHPYFNGMVAFQEARCQSNNYVMPETDEQLLAYFIDEANLHDGEVNRAGKADTEWIAYHSFWAAAYHAAATLMLAVGIVPTPTSELFEQETKE